MSTTVVGVGSGSELEGDDGTGDPMLMQVLGMLNAATEPESGSPITLLVGGSIITGEAVPRWRWLTEFHDSLHGDGVYFGDVVATPEADAEAEAVGQYVHLRNARVVTAGIPASGDGIRMRIRVSQVAGWAFGRRPAEKVPDARIIA